MTKYICRKNHKLSTIKLVSYHKLTLIIIVTAMISNLFFYSSVSARIKIDSLAHVNIETTESIVTYLDDFFHINSKIANTQFSKVVAHLEGNDKNYDKRDFPFKTKLDEIIKNKKRIDIGKKFIDEIINYNDRLAYYDIYIKLAKKEGYVVTSYIDYLNNYKNTDMKVLILRHDIDIPSGGTKLMFEIEKKNKVKATYYFRWTSFDKDLIKEISNAGFEVGLHYETIATYCKKHNKTTVTPEDLNECRNLLKKEIKDFKEETDINIQTVASHGSLINKRIGIPNNVLFDGQKYSDFGIVGETYNKEILKNYVKSYICDNDILKKSGYSYKSNPIDALIAKKKVIEFLSHPNHWYYDICDRAKMDIIEETNLSNTKQ